jgi:hypothetical protein
MWLFGNRKLELSNAELRPYVLKLREGYLIGLAYLPSVASPFASVASKNGCSIGRFIDGSRSW